MQNTFAVAAAAWDNAVVLEVVVEEVVAIVEEVEGAAGNNVVGEEAEGDKAYSAH